MGEELRKFDIPSVPTSNQKICYLKYQATFVMLKLGFLCFKTFQCLGKFQLYPLVNPYHSQASQSGSDRLRPVELKLAVEPDWAAKQKHQCR